MLKIGLTGNIAAGKSAIEKMLESMSIKVIDADKICHELYDNKEIQNKIQDSFKDDDIFENNQISRKKLGDIIFKSDEKRKILENILHPVIIQNIKDFFENCQDEKLAVASVPLLFEAKMESIFDKIIIVCADEKIRAQRIIERNNITQEESFLRIKSQMPQEEKIKLADFVLDNSGSLENTKGQLQKIIKLIEQ